MVDIIRTIAKLAQFYRDIFLQRLDSHSKYHFIKRL